jgi:hypothetical protein
MSIILNGPKHAADAGDGIVSLNEALQIFWVGE